MNCHSDKSLEVCAAKTGLEHQHLVAEQPGRYEHIDQLSQIHLLHELLGDHPEEHEAQEVAHGVLLIRGENIDQAVNRLEGRVGMERAEHQVTRFRGGKRHFDGLLVAQLAHEDIVRILPEHPL